MVHHIILWKLKDDKTEEEKKTIKANIKSGLEGLKDVIPGIEQIIVRTNKLESSNCDLMLDSIFTNETSLKNYSVNPAHVKVTDTYVRPNVEIRMCIDYEE